MKLITPSFGDIKDRTPQAPEELLSLLYSELRKLAAARMAREAPDHHTLQPTALVHEAWLRLAADGDKTWENRAHFFSAVAEAMRRILVDKVRSKRSQKRGSGLRPIDLDRIDVAVESDSESLLSVNEALDRLTLADPQAAALIKLRFFVGLDYEAAAEVLGISVRTAKRLWTFGRAWLYRELSK